MPSSEPSSSESLSSDLPPDFDTAPLDGIRDMLPDAEFRAFIDACLADATARLDRIRALGAAGDVAALAREAHILVSTSGSCGLARVSALARRLEAAGKAGSAADARALVAEIAESSHRGWAALRGRFLPAGS